MIEHASGTAGVTFKPQPLQKLGMVLSSASKGHIHITPVAVRRIRVSFLLDCALAAPTMMCKSQ